MKGGNSTLYNKVHLLPIFSNIIGIDKLVIDLPRLSCKVEDLIEFPTLIVDKKTGEMLCKGKICNGIFIKEYSDSIKLFINPAIYLYGNNFVSISYFHIKILIDLIMKEYKINIADGIIRRMDLQCTIKTNQNPNVYFNILGRYKNFIRNTVGSTLYYNSKSSKKYKTGMFYDKKKEASSNIPIEFINGEFLRIEWQYFNKLLKNKLQELSLNKMFIKHLLDKNIYQFFINLWFSDYLTIYKENVKIIDMNLINKISDLDNMLINQGIEKIGGFMNLENMIDQSRAFINRKSDFFSKMKKRYRDKSKLPKFICDSPLFFELNEKVEIAFQNTLHSL